MDAALAEHLPRRRRRAQVTTRPIPPGDPSPALPLRVLMAHQPPALLDKWARRFLLVVALGFVAIAAAVFLGLLVAR